MKLEDTYVCDQCGLETPARTIRPRGTNYTQTVAPIGWFSLEGRYQTGAAKPLRLRADLCSARCARHQIDEWAEAPLTTEEEQHVSS